LARGFAGFPQSRGIDQIVLADNAVAIADEIDQQVEHLGFERDRLARAAQLAPPNIEYVIAEREQHRRSPCPMAARALLKKKTRLS
jgi:hypothetical protein